MKFNYCLDLDIYIYIKLSNLLIYSLNIIYSKLNIYLIVAYRETQYYMNVV